MRRALSSSLCVALLWGSSAAARPPLPVVIVEPAVESCVSAEALSIGLAHAGPFLPRLVPEQVSAIPAAQALFRVDGEPQRLRVRGFGLREMLGGDELERWPLSDPEPVADVDELITGQTCDTATEAVVALIASVLMPAGGARPDDERVASTRSPSAGVAGALERAQRQLAHDPELAAGVLSTELGLTLIVEDLHGACRRGTWLDVRGDDHEMGLNVAELEQAVLACLEEQRREGDRASFAAAPPTTRQELAMRLPTATGALVAGLGIAAGAVALTQVSKPGPLLVYSAAPPLLGGVMGYVAPRPWRDAVWLSGYWVGVAGTTLIAGLRGGDLKPALIGGFLTAGAMGSAGLSLLSAGRSEDGAMPASVAIPAAVGSGLAMLGLLVKGRGSNSIELATVGALAAIAPTVWLQLTSGDGAPDRAPLGLGVDVSEHGAVLGVSGEL